MSASHVELSVTPLDDENPVGTTHTLTATVTPAGANQSVILRVSAGPNEGDVRAVATDALGQATLSCVGVGDGGVGTDDIIVWVDLDTDGQLDGDEPARVATKTWTAATAASIVSLEPQRTRTPWAPPTSSPPPYRRR